MPHLAHQTLKSSPDENGNCHRLYIEPSSDKCNKHLTTYKTKLFSYAKNKFSDPRHEQICIAKFPATGHGTKQWATLEVRKSQLVRKTSKMFTQTFFNNSSQLVFTCPQHASLDAVAIGSRKRCRGEYVVFEDKMASFEHFLDNSGRITESSSTSKSRHRNKTIGSKAKSTRQETSCQLLKSDKYHGSLEMTTHTQPYIVTPSAPPYEEEPLPSYEQLFGTSVHQTVINNNNNNSHYYNMNSLPHHEDWSSCRPPAYSEYDPGVHHDRQCSQPVHTNSWDCDHGDNGPHALLTAFIHFDFCQANGQRIVCNLKGMCEGGNRYTLTTPTMHSLTGEFGKRDQGQAGMMEVIANHVCCSWCRHLPSMHYVFEQAQVNATLSLT
ncbi:unnamed protein product [Candidula unifasciata]|uniref:Alpha-type protein kinase domain-containing protein n=1 Tax=Candidula unifasciata TaxID=100452 RepID=A0A8S3Z9C1_9EUPU|nr:unnamed protein product [Candidula unifasciata]